jgi:hypothetical protein
MFALLLHLILGVLGLAAVAWTFGRTLAASAANPGRAAVPIRAAVAARWPSRSSELPTAEQSSFTRH